MNNLNKLSGWVRLYRSFEQWEWYDNSYCVHIFLHILLKANHKQNKWRGILVERGEFITSIDHISKQTSISIQSVKTVLDKLELTGEITRQSTNRYTRITICKYESYQDNEVVTNNQTNKQTNKQNEIKVTDEQPATNKQLTTNKNDNTFKNEKRLLLMEEILKNSKIYFQTICFKYKIKDQVIKKMFCEFFKLNFAERETDFNKDDVRKYFANKLPDLIKNKPGSPGGNKPGHNRPE